MLYIFGYPGGLILYYTYIITKLGIDLIICNNFPQLHQFIANSTTSSIKVKMYFTQYLPWNSLDNSNSEYGHT